jgi:ribosomal protein L17
MYKGRRGPKARTTDKRGEPNVHGNMDLRVIEQRCDEMLREAELNRLKKALRATRKRPAISRLASTVAWEFARAGGLIRKLLRTLRNGD